MDDGWRRVATAVKERRLALDLTQEAAAELGGKSISSASWRVIEAAGRPKYRAATLLGVCTALEWTSDSIDRVYGGQEPIIVASAAEMSGPWSVDTIEVIERLGELTQELVRRAREGRL